SSTLIIILSSSPQVRISSGSIVGLKRGDTSLFTSDASSGKDEDSSWVHEEPHSYIYELQQALI
nr:hypothetical protein [Tanacetum cinerariifolium]